MYSKEVVKKSRSMSSTKKRSKKNTWGSRERTSMSFLLVIAFFAIFGIIILTEVRKIFFNGQHSNTEKSFKRF
jgi:preprotein translocase subunit SecE